MIKHTDVVTAIHNQQYKFLFFGSDACNLATLLHDVAMSLNPDAAFYKQSVLEISRDNLGSNTGDFKDMIKNRIQRKTGGATQMNYMILIGIESLNLNLQNWLQETLRTVQIPILMTTTNVHEIHPNLLSHFFVISAPRIRSPLEAKLATLPHDLSGTFWENYCTNTTPQLTSFHSLEDIKDYWLRRNINPTTFLDMCGGEHLNLPALYLKSKVNYLPQLAPMSMIL